jgi:hypothetical protein
MFGNYVSDEVCSSVTRVVALLLTTSAGKSGPPRYTRLQRASQSFGNVEPGDYALVRSESPFVTIALF